MIAFAAPLIVGVALLIGWDALRAQPDSLWTLALANNTPDSLIAAAPITTRLGDWFDYARQLLGTPTLLFAVGALAMLFWRATRQLRERDGTDRPAAGGISSWRTCCCTPCSPSTSIRAICCR